MIGRSGISQKDPGHYEGTLREFHGYCVTNEVVSTDDVRPATIKGYLLACQRDRENNPTSINHKLQNLRVFFNYLEQAEVIDRKGPRPEG